MSGNSLEHDALGDELGVDVGVVHVLPEVEFLLVENSVGVELSDVKSCGTISRDMNKTCTNRQAQFHTFHRTTNVHILDFCTLGEVLNNGSTVEDSVDGGGGTTDYITEVLSDIASNDDESSAIEELLEVCLEVIVQECLQSLLSIGIGLATHEAVDGFHIRLDEFVEHMNAEETSGSREQDMVHGLHLSFLERPERVALQQRMDGGVVVVGDGLVVCQLTFLSFLR